VPEATARSPRWQVGSIADGIVTHVATSSVYVDIGAEKDALLVVPTALRRQIQKKDVMRGMIIDAVDANGYITVSLPDPHLETEDEQPQAVAKAKPKASKPVTPVATVASSRAATGSGATGKGQGKASRGVSGRFLDHPKGAPLEDFAVGDEVIGIVASLDGGVLLDVGTVVDGWLKVPRRDAKKLQIGDQVEGILIDEIDMKDLRLTLSLPYQLGEPVEDHTGNS